MSKQKNDTIAEPPVDEDEISEASFDGSVVDPDSSKKVSFASLGLDEVLCNTCEKLGWSHATAIQAASIPYALQGKDVIGLAQTGSGKTGSFALPILHQLLQHPQPLYALVMAPTRYERACSIGLAIGRLIIFINILQRVGLSDLRTI
jgi:ATP-dependent RNA helicase DDX47/RRP3